MLYQGLKKFAVLILLLSPKLYTSHVDTFDHHSSNYSSNQSICLSKNMDDDGLDRFGESQVSPRSCCNTSRVNQNITGTDNSIDKFDCLPAEIWEKILLCLDMQSLKSCRSASQLFADVVLNTQNFQAHKLVLKLQTMNDFTTYLSHNRQHSLQAINITFTVGDNVFAHVDLSHLKYLSSKQICVTSIGELKNKLKNLKILNLRKNFIKDVGVMAWIEADLSNLVSLNLDYNMMSDVSLIVLSQSNFHNLTKLSLRHNQIESMGVVALAKSTLTAITELDLSHNRIRSTGVMELIQGLTHLIKLDLRYNQIDNKNIIALSQSHSTYLTTLALPQNPIENVEIWRCYMSAFLR